MKAKTKSRIALSAAALLLVAAGSIAFLLYSWREAAITPPSPNGTPDATEEQSTNAEEDDGFPVVDWAYWQGINSDVIGWITVPGTTIDSPIVQAPANDPEYYLHHDIYKNYNPHGAIYLDADCPDGLLSKNVVIMGHHYGYDVVAAPFGTVADYVDKDFAEQHATVLIQTPEWKKTYEVRFAQIVNGLERNKRTTFADEEDYRSWYDSSRADAAMVLDPDTEPEQTVCLVSCSYYIWVKNERTVLVTSEKDSPEMPEITEIEPEAF